MLGKIYLQMRRMASLEKKEIHTQMNLDKAQLGCKFS